jgi:hypothetical protein
MTFVSDPGQSMNPFYARARVREGQCRRPLKWLKPRTPFFRILAID